MRALLTRPWLALVALLAAYAVASLYPFHPLRWGFPRPVANGAEALPGGGLRFVTPGIARTPGPPDWLAAVMESGRLALSLRLQSLAADQVGPARIVTISVGPLHRNLTLAQDGADLILRLRTPATNLNGIGPGDLPVARLAGLFGTPGWREVALVVEPGRLRLGQGGVGEAEVALPPDALRDWDPSYPLALGNELTHDRPWLGEITRALVTTPAGTIDYAAPGALSRAARFWSAIGPATLVPFRERSLEDATLNLLGYLPLGLLLGALGRARGWGAGRLVACIFLTSAAFELLQFALPDRHPSTTDLLLNTLGGALGVACGPWLWRRTVTLWQAWLARRL